MRLFLGSRMCATPISCLAATRQKVTTAPAATSRLQFSINFSLPTTSLSSFQPNAQLQHSGEKSPLQNPYELIDTPQTLSRAMKQIGEASSAALDIEAFCTEGSEKQLGAISLVQVCCGGTDPVVFIFDILSLQSDFAPAFKPFLESTHVKKLFFDCRRDVEALSCQMGLVPRGVVDLQLLYTAVQWKLRSVNRRSGMPYVLKQVTGVSRHDSDTAVQLAMTVGNRPVWDVRPLPPHFMEYAASDVWCIMQLAPHLSAQSARLLDADAVERLTAAYVEHYGTGIPVTRELDSHPAEVHLSLLERFVGPGGVCHFCNAKGHTEAECFKKMQGLMKCTFCGESGHTSRNCFRKFPQLLKCEVCGQIGHTAASCFKKNPCKHCSGNHNSVNCHKKVRKVPYVTTV